jgi:hypothetical protein
VITEALAIELTKNCMINGQDEKPLDYENTPNGGVVINVPGPDMRPVFKDDYTDV